MEVQLDINIIHYMYALITYSFYFSLSCCYALTLHMYTVVAVQDERFAFKLTVKVVQEGTMCTVVTHCISQLLSNPGILLFTDNLVTMFM